MPPESLALVQFLNLRDTVLGRFLGLIGFILFASFSVAGAASVTLTWNASPSPSVAGYKVYYTTVSGASSPVVDVGNVTTTTISNLNNSTTYYFSVTAYNSGGVESQRSNEISYRTPSLPLDTFTLTVNGGSGSGVYSAGIWVPVSADSPGSGEKFAYWDGDTSILQTPRTNANNQAFIPLRDATITAVYSDLPTYAVLVTSGTGDGNYFAGDTVSIVADPAPAGEQFAGWTGNVTFANASSSTTTFTMPSSTVAVTATYSALGSGDTIRYFPREGYNLRMVGGVFEGTNGDPVTGPYSTIHTISTTPSSNWTSVGVSLGSYRYLRYRGPNGSHANVAEIEFYRAGSKLTGTGFGTSGSWSGAGDTFVNALDGDTETFFDGPDANGSYVGIDTGSSQGTGLLGRYYNNVNAAGSPVLTRTDATVDFDWQDGSPASQVASDYFSVRWTGQVKAPVSGTYTFTVTADDGVRLFINGTQVINAWTVQSATSYTYTTTLTAGTLYNIELHYYENWGLAVCRLRWSYPGQSMQVVPRSQLYPSN
jgi:PA14 domain/Fibronectin type III domain/Divergent InlB B-repeat domain